MPRPKLLVPAFGALSGLFFCASALRAGTAPDLVPHATLVVEAGALTERCLSKSELEQAVQAQLGKVVFVDPGAAATLLVRVVLEEPEPGRFRATVTSEPIPAAERGGASTRELEAAGDCRALDEPLSLVVALLVDADPLPPPPEPEPEPAPEPPPEPPAPPVQDTSPVSSAPSWDERSAGPWHLALGMAGVAGVGVLPHLAAGAALDVTVTPPAWPALRLRATGFAPDRARAAPGAWLGVTLAFGGLGVCPELGAAGRFRISGCLGVEATLLHVKSHGLEGGRGAIRAGGQASGALLAGFVLGGGFRVTLEAGTSLPFRSERFTVDRDGRREVLYRTPFAPAILSLGLAHEFY